MNYYCYFTIRGNRQKVANQFVTPTTWIACLFCSVVTHFSLFALDTDMSSLRIPRLVSFFSPCFLHM
jgi:hypothetical protein